jgi:hypothetical protein
MIAFKHQIPNKYNCFGIKIYNSVTHLATCHGNVLSKARKHATTDITANHAAVKQQTRTAKGHGHQFFS